MCISGVLVLLVSVLVLQASSRNTPCKYVLHQNRDGFKLRCITISKSDSAERNLIEKITMGGYPSEENFKETDEEDVPVSVPENSKDEKLRAIIQEVFSKKYIKTEEKNGHAGDIILDRTNVDAPFTCTDGGMPDLDGDCLIPE